MTSFPKLRTLDLSHNNLQTISKDTLKNLITTRLVDQDDPVSGEEVVNIPVVILDDNPWHCDCNIMEVASFINETSDMFPSGSDQLLYVTAAP